MQLLMGAATYEALMQVSEVITAVGGAVSLQSKFQQQLPIVLTAEAWGFLSSPDLRSIEAVCREWLYVSREHHAGWLQALPREAVELRSPSKWLWTFQRRGIKAGRLHHVHVLRWDSTRWCSDLKGSSGKRITAYIQQLPELNHLDLRSITTEDAQSTFAKLEHVTTLTFSRQPRVSTVQLSDVTGFAFAEGIEDLRGLRACDLPHVPSFPSLRRLSLNLYAPDTPVCMHFMIHS